jgi:hypothetical protein
MHLSVDDSGINYRDELLGGIICPVSVAHNVYCKRRTREIVIELPVSSERSWCAHSTLTGHNGTNMME